MATQTLTPPPGPKTRWPLANMGVFKNGFLEFLMEMRENYGDVCQFKIATRKMALVCDPDVVRDILVTNNKNFTKSRGLRVMGRFLLGNGLLTNEGESHRKQRRLIQPAFTKQRIDQYAEDMIACTLKSMSKWEDGATIDMDDEMMQTALAIAARTMFGAEVDGEAEEISNAMSEAMSVFEMLADPLMPIKQNLPLPRNRRIAKARERIDATIFRMIADRRAEGRHRGDFLDILLSARDEDDKTGMTDRQVRDEAITLFLAGHETTANAMTWAWHLLSTHEDVQEKMCAEVTRVCGGRPPNADDVPQLQYTRQVFAESMRLYPPAHSFGRLPIEDYDTGHGVLTAGTTIILSPYVMHRHPKYWPNAEQFLPDRWLPEEIEKRPKTAYIPFGGGPRVCIGEPFAWVEGILVLAAIAREWKVAPCPGHKVEHQALVTLRPRYGMRLITQRRNKKANGKSTEAA